MARQFKSEWRKRIEVQCAACGAPFLAVASEVKRGRGKTCSRSCAASLAVVRPQIGPNNGNWKGGISRTWRQRAEGPQVVEAHKIVADAIRNGLLVQGACEVCGSEKVHGHHEDYAKPLDVRWLCGKHHAERHKELREAA